VARGEDEERRGRTAEVEATDREKRGKARALAGGGEGTRGKELVEEEARGRRREGERVNAEKGRGEEDEGRKVSWLSDSVAPVPSAACKSWQELPNVRGRIGRSLARVRSTTGPVLRVVTCRFPLALPPRSSVNDRSLTSRSRLDGFYRSHSRPRFVSAAIFRAEGTAGSKERRGGGEEARTAKGASVPFRGPDTARVP